MPLRMRWPGLGSWSERRLQQGGVCLQRTQRLQQCTRFTVPLQNDGPLIAQVFSEYLKQKSRRLPPKFMEKSSVPRVSRANLLTSLLHRRAKSKRIARGTLTPNRQRYQFNLLVNCVREKLEPQTWWAKQCTINSSGVWVRAELKIAAILHVLAGGSYLDASDLFAVSAENFHRWVASGCKNG
jgi:hypothetical protein